MSTGISQSAIDVLGLPNPRIYITAEIIKNYYATQTIEDVTADVVSYGILRNISNIVSVDWEVPNMTIILDNSGLRYNRESSDNFWDESPAKAPEECVIRIDMRARLPNGSGELLQRYVGQIRNILPRIDPGGALVELETTSEAVRVINDKIVKIVDGPANEYDATLDTNTDIYNPSGLTVAPPIVTTFNNTLNPAEPFTYRENDLQYTATGYTRVFSSSSTYTSELYGEALHMAYDAIEPFWSASVRGDFRWRDPAAADRYRHMFNPVAYSSQAPDDIVEDLIQYIGASNSAWWDSSSFSTFRTYWSGKSPEPVIDAACVGKTILGHILEILTYAPEAIFFLSHDSKLTILKWPKYSDESSPLVISSGNQSDFISLDRPEYNKERMASRIVLSYGWVTPKGVWWLDDDDQVNYSPVPGDTDYGRQRRTLRPRGRGSDYSPNTTERILSSATETRELELDRPWWRHTHASVATFVSEFLDDYENLYATPISTYEARVRLAGLQIEIGDIIQLDIAELGMSAKKLIVMGKDIDFDNLEVILYLFDREFTD